MRIIVLFTGLMLICANAQETRNSISGQVTDPQGSPIPGAVVLVTDTDTNTSTHLTTNETGYYQANLLLPGHYQVTVEAAGFKKTTRPGIVLDTGGNRQVPFQLEIGSLAESIVVSAAAPILDTSTVSSGRVLTTREVADLPVMVNNVMLLAMQAPGIQTAGINQYNAYNSVPASTNFGVDGRVGGNAFSLDGVPIPGPNRYVAFLPHADTLQEFRVETSNFDASVGKTTGANVVMLTKTGTNQFHGTITEQHWQQRWNGTPFFVKQLYYRQIAQLNALGDHAGAAALAARDKQASGHSNNFAGTLGGPVRIPKVFNGKDKLFFFFSFNGTRTNQSEDPNNLNNTVPTPGNLRGDFSDLLKVNSSLYQIYDPLSVRPDPARAGHFIRDPIAGNILPASRMINPAYATYAKFWPAPNNNPISAAQEPTNNYIAAGEPWNSTYNAFTNRVDYQASDKNRFFASWGWYQYRERRSDWTFQTAPGLVGTGTTLHERTATIDWVYTATAATVLNGSLAVLDKRDGPVTPEPLVYKPSDVGLPAYMDVKAGDRHMLPQMNVAGYKSIGPGNYPSWARYRVLSGKLNGSHVEGKHSLQAGFNMWKHLLAGGNTGATSGAFTFTNTYTRRNDDTFTPGGTIGLSWADFLMGLPDAMSIATNDNFITTNPYFGWFVQDNWRVNQRLTVNLGLRLEYELGPTERYNRMIGSFVPAAALPIAQGAQAAYAKNPVPELAASSFLVAGGPQYVGANGASRRLVQSALSWLPRLGLSYQLNSKTVLRGGYGLYADTFNVLYNTPDQTGYSRPTSTVVTNDFGVHWLAGNPTAGISPLRDPFPVRADGTRFDTPLKNALGSMAKVGNGFGFIDYNLQHARQQHWRLGVQRQLGKDMVLDVAYAGSYSDHIPIQQRLDALPVQFWNSTTVRNNTLAANLDANVTNPFAIANFAALQQSNPVVYQNMLTQGFFTSGTIRKSQLLRPFPQMNGLNDNTTPAGEARTDALEINMQRRFAKGIVFNASYTRLNGREATAYQNEFDPQPIWLESNNGRPHRLTGSAIWQLPFGKGRSLAKSGVPNVLFGGFQIAVTYEWQPGPLLQFPNLFYYGNLPDIDTGTRTLDQWFNTANFERAAAKSPANYQARVFPMQVGGVRADQTNQWNANVQREFKLRERLALQIRVEALNLQNRSQFNGPIVNPTATNFGTVVSQTSATNRFLQVQGRIRF